MTLQYLVSHFILNFFFVQRQYRNYLAGTKPCSLTEIRIAILNQLEFCWDASPKSYSAKQGINSPNRAEALYTTSDNTEWWRYLQEFRELSQEMQETRRGTSVTRALPRTTTPLGKWLQYQRHVYQKQQQRRVDAETSRTDRDDHSDSVSLSDKQIAALSDLDPDWWMNHRQWQWEIRYRELQNYALKHGDCCVPISHSNRQLAHFVSNQRKQYNLKKQGKPSNLTEDRLKRLNAMNPNSFVWNRWEYEFSKKLQLWEE
jgi:hypothetical protein